LKEWAQEVGRENIEPYQVIKFDLAKKELKGHLDLRKFLKLNDNENLYLLSQPSPVWRKWQKSHTKREINNGFVFSLFAAVVIFFLGFTIEKGQKK
jgi:hypothetical protein